MSNKAPDVLLRVEEVAEILDCSRWKVYLLLDSGALPSIKLGKLRRVRRETLMAFLAAQEQSEPVQSLA